MIQQAILTSIIAVIALIVAVFLVCDTIAFRNSSVAIPAEYVGGSGLNWAELRFERDGQEVVQGVRGYYPFYSKGDPIPARRSLTEKSIRADNFMTSWVFVIALGWIVLSFGTIGIASFLWRGEEGE